MLDIKLIREQTELVKNALRKRHMDTDLIEEIVALDEKRRALILDVESKKSRTKCGFQRDRSHERQRRA